jgi:membrane-associated phospholipid phosphatase
VIALIYLASHPDFLLIAMQSYALTATFRMLAMYSIPLDPPETIIPLIDPFVEFFGGGTTLEKDLFFSGHTSTMFLLFLTARQRVIRKIFLILTILVGLCVLLQHVHYTVDVIIAPFVAFTSYRIALCFNK